MWKYDKTRIGERIRAKRVRLGLTQEETAEKIGRAVKYYADIERGYCGMSIYTMMALCDALRMSPNGLLLGEAVAAFDDSDQMERLKAAVLECSEEQRACVLQVALLMTKER